MEFFGREEELAELRKVHEIKVESSRIDPNALKRKSEVFFAKNPKLRERKISYGLLSLDDM